MKKISGYISYFPTMGILLFFALFAYSSTLYPGGSQADVNSVGYDWMNNYWCNLMNEYAMNEELNPARSFAITAMILLCSSLMLFFIQFSIKIARNTFWRNAIKWGGMLSMIFAAFMFSEFHDLMTTLSSIFGVLVVIGIIWEIYKSRLTGFKITGVACILLLGINNYIYYSEVYIEYLPIIQKVMFIVVLFWIVGLNFAMNMQKTNT
ncbi:MAG: hypothetical protein P8P74_17570 [Crocinitomicaceae bacterium]|nr:hypothetical protein [Crocinitomicaceae bacterium]